MKAAEYVLVFAGLAALASGDGHLRGARRLATNRTTYKVFLFIEDDSAATRNCTDVVEQLIDDEYGEEVVREGEEPPDPVIVHEFTACNETFVNESLARDNFIYLEDSSAQTYFCLDKLLDAYEENEAVDVAYTGLFIDETSCGDQDALDELLGDIDYALWKEESYGELVSDILDYYG